MLKLKWGCKKLVFLTSMYVHLTYVPFTIRANTTTLELSS